MRDLFDIPVRAAGASKLVVDGRWIGRHGIGRFAKELLLRLPAGSVIRRGLPLLHPLEPLWLSIVLMRTNPDVYFSPGFNPPLVAKCSFAFTIHDLVHLSVPEEGSAAKYVYYHCFLRSAARRAAAVFTVSEFSRKEIIKRLRVVPEKVFVVRNGVSAAFCQRGPSVKLSMPYLLYVGNRKPHKNFDGLLRAYSLSGLAERGLLVVTGFPDAASLELATRLGIKDQVIYIGLCEDSELASWIRGAVAVVCPSKCEGFCLPVLEAMACGTAVVASNVSAIPEIAEEAAVFVDPYDDGSIADGMVKIWEDEQLRRGCVEAGLNRAELFTWTGAAARVKEVLEEAAEACWGNA
jgi:glycosyltransferase involved in cell wall biosynthesis